jgi:hypothetical protein
MTAISLTEISFDLFPLMEAAEFDALVADIRQNGLRQPIAIYEDQILDGRKCERACRTLGIQPGYRPGPSGNHAEALAYVISANSHRRHLTATQRRDLIAKLVKLDPEQSNRAIAATAKVDDKTVSAVREEMEATAELPPLTRTTGRDGKERPAHARSDRNQEEKLK